MDKPLAQNGYKRIINGQDNKDNRGVIGYTKRYVKGEIEGYQWIYKKNIYFKTE
jgi:hypothetical protein